MTKIIIYSESSLDGFYEQTLEYLHDKYHVHSTTLTERPITAAEAAHISYYDAMGRDAGRHSSRGRCSARGYRDSNFSSQVDISGDVPIGKAVF